MLKNLLMLPFTVLYALAIVLCILTDLILKPFIYASTFLYSFMNEITK
jgi:hypothetical protein